MKKLILTLLIITSSLLAKVTHLPLSQTLIDSKIPIVDIRNTGEWQRTGIIKGSIPIQFFDQQYRVNVKEFIAQLKAQVDTSKPFAIICKTGSRTKKVASFLSTQYNYDVTNITGGIYQYGNKKRFKNLDIIRY